MIRVGIIGFGYWGPNLVRCFSQIPDCKVTAVCDARPDKQLAIKERFPTVRVLDNIDSLLDHNLVDAVVIATPTATHYEIAKKALEHDFHVFVEKPLAETSLECKHLIDIAAERNRLLFVGHIFLHSAPVIQLKEIVESGELGAINYISSRRLNLGPVRQDVGALFDLAPHDISMILYLMGGQPTSVTCAGFDHLKSGIHDVCNLSINFPNNKMGIVHVSWLDPKKERVLTVVGDKKMAVYDDLQMEKIKVFDRGIDCPKPANDFAEFQLSYRYGGSYCPFIQDREPLKAECSEFIRCIVDGDSPITDGHNGLEVVEVLEAGLQSLRQGGELVEINPIAQEAGK